MRTIIEADRFPVCSSSGTTKQPQFLTTTTKNLSPQHSRTNSNDSEEDSVLSDYIFIPSSPSSGSLIFPSNTR